MIVQSLVTQQGSFMNIDTEIQKDFAPPKYPPQLTDLSHIIEIGVCERRN